MEVLQITTALLITAIVVTKTIAAFRNYRLSANYLATCPIREIHSASAPFILLVVPVLREQAIILGTINRLISLDYPADRFAVVVVGSRREVEDRRAALVIIPEIVRRCVLAKNVNSIAEVTRGLLPRSAAARLFELRDSLTVETLSELLNSELTTEQVVKNWLANREVVHPRSGVAVSFVSCPEISSERAVQLDFAVRDFIAHTARQPDIIGVYDADSRPEIGVLSQVARTMPIQGLAAAQQPLQYLDAAAKLALSKANPILVANALYQTAWSMIKELPRLIQYETQIARRRTERASSLVLYMNGHGEFLTRKLYDWLGGFPKATTDGIQLGYRLSLAGIPIAPLRCCCSDDVPTSLSALIRQHKRWYAGNVEFPLALRWARKKGYKVSPFAVIDNLILNLTWAARPIVPLGGVALLIAMRPNPLLWPLAACILGAVVVYCYLLPGMAARLLRKHLEVRLIDLACLPLAICFKSLGPLVFLAGYIGQTLFRRPITFEKVER